MAALQGYPVARTRSKICGITSREDALAAIAAGADALGFVFYAGSPRAVDKDVISPFLAELPPLVSKVGLFLNADRDYVASVIDQLPLDLLQFHGTETAEYCDSFGKPYIKALGAARAEELSVLADNYPGASALLFDSHPAGKAGGTGEVFDWSQLPASLTRPLILAGGLTPDNVAEAVRKVRPYAVDVSSGVESAPGRKDSNLMNQFVARLRRADSE